MLQHNVAKTGRPAHLAHAAVVGVHAICCGLPAMVMLAAALTGATSGTALVSVSFTQFHGLLHAHEIWILAASGGLVVVGGWLEAVARRARRSAGFPWLFALSVFCLLANVAIVAAHRLA
jgi:hypothetical protein